VLGVMATVTVATTVLRVWCYGYSETKNKVSEARQKIKAEPEGPAIRGLELEHQVHERVYRCCN